MSTTLLAIIIVLAVFLAGLFVIARWVYFDAKRRGMEPWPMVWLVILRSKPSTLIAYYFLRPQLPADIICKECNTSVPGYLDACPHCDAQITPPTHLLAKYPPSFLKRKKKQPKK